MNRKWAALGCAALVLLVIGGGMYALEYQPAFYAQTLADIRSIESRREQATAFEQTALDLFNEIRFEEQWSHEFTDESINDWLSQNLMVRFNELLPPEISAPRVRFEQDRVLLGFQIRRGMWRGVVSSRIHAWVSGPNQLALDIETAELGMIPVPVDEFLAGLVQKLKAAGWTLEWKHNGARDVLVVTINSGDGSDSENRAALESMEINPGVLRISGRRTSQTEPLSDATTDAKAG